MSSSLFVTLGIAAGLPFAATAAPVSWDGDTDTDFATGTNWVGDSAPVNDLATDIATFGVTPTANQPALTGAYAVNGLDFQGGGWTLGGGSTLSLGSGGISSTGDNAVSAILAASGGSVISSASGGTLSLGVITGNTVTFGTATDLGTVELAGTSDNNSFSPVVAYGTLILNKGTPGGGNSGSATNNLTIDTGATAIFGANRTDRGNGKGQIWGTATVNGTMDLNGDGSFGANWGMNGISGSGTIENNGSGAARISIAYARFNGTLEDGTQTTGLLVRNTGTDRAEIFGTSNTYSGGTTVQSGGSLWVESDGSLGATSGALTLDGGKLQNHDSSLTLDAARIINLEAAGGTLQAGWSKNVVVNGVIQGPGALTIASDSGSVLLLGVNNTYQGGTVFNGDGNNGKTQVESDGSLGDPDGDITLAGGRLKNDNSVLTLNAMRTVTIIGTGSRMQAGWGKDLTIEGVVEGSGDLTVDGDGGTVIWNGENTFTGNIGMVQEYSNSKLRIGGSLGTGGNYAGTLSTNHTNSIFEYAGTGTQILSGDNSGYNGGIKVSGGVLQAGSANALGTGEITIAAGGTLDVNGYEFTNAIAANPAGTLSNTGAAVDYSSTTITSNGSSLTVDGTGDITLGEIARTGGSPGIVKDGTNELTMVGVADNVSVQATVNEGTLVLAKTSTGSVHTIGAGLTINGGTARLGGTGDDQIYNGTGVTANGGTFDVGALNERIKFLNIHGGSITGTTGVLTVNSFSGDGSIDARSGSVSAILAGDASLTKSTTGTVTLSAANTYTGATIINEGTLELTPTGSIANSSEIALNGGNFNVSAVTGFTLGAGQALTGSGSITGDITVGGFLAIGDSPGTATFEGDLTLASTAISDFEITLASLALGSYDLAEGGAGSQTVTFGGTLNLLFDSGEAYVDDSTVQIFDFETYVGDFDSVTFSGLAPTQLATFDALTGVVTIVPEPGTLSLIGLFLGLGLFRRRRVV